MNLLVSIAAVVTAAALAGGCASWNAQDGNDFQCEAVSNEGRNTALGDRQDTSRCGANYAAADVAHELTREGKHHELGHD